MGSLIDEIIRQCKYRENGFLVIPGFLGAERVSALKEAAEEVVRDYCKNSPISVFGDQSRDTYFAESGDKICGFYEESAVDASGKLLMSPENALNKVGHALHVYNDTFRNVTISSRVKEIVKAMTNIEEPMVIQSMVIFKHPQVGGEVKAHQDASYLYSEPSERRLIGFWIALDEASLENGCLHFVPGSQAEGKVYQRFVRNTTREEGSPLFVHRGESVPQVGDEKWVAAPVKPGDLVLIDGLVLHRSEPNRSLQRRMAYTFHVADGATKWSEENWLQPTEKQTFVRFPIYQ